MGVDLRVQRHEFDSLEQEYGCLNLADQLCHEGCSQVLTESDQEHSDLGLQLTALVRTLCHLESQNH